MATDPQTRIDLLGDADPDVRLQMALALGESRHAAAAPALVARFGVERDFAIRETLTWAVLRMADAAMPLVREALDSERWLARLQATHTVSKLGAREDGVRLLPRIADPVDAVAARAWWAAAQCGDPAAVPALVGQLSRGSSADANSLLVALAEFGGAAVAPLVAALQRSPAPAVRRHAADALGYLGSPDADAAAPALAEAVRDEDEAVRLAALNALGQLVLPAAWAVIDATTGSPDPRLALLARRLGERRPPERALRLAALRAGPAAPLEGVDDHEIGPAPSWPTPDPSLVELEGGPWAAELVPALALQVAVCRPRHLSRADVPAEELAAVHDAARAEALAAGRPAAIAERIAAGRVEQHVHEQVLLEQVSVADPGVVVADLLRGTEVRVTGFARPPTPTRWCPAAST